jgi:hypothetical protein
MNYAAAMKYPIEKKGGREREREREKRKREGEEQDKKRKKDTFCSTRRFIAIYRFF